MQWPLASFPTKVLHAPRASGGPNYLEVTASGTINTKGSWEELFSSTAGAASYLTIYLRNFSGGTDTASLVDIGIGAAGSEQVVMPNLLGGFHHHLSGSVQLPFHIPSGVRVAARAQAAVASRNTGLCIDVYGGEPAPGLSVFSKMVDYGTVTGTSGGTLVAPSAVAGTKGSWVQLTSSTSTRIDALMVMTQGSTSNQTAGIYTVDIGIGAAASETIIVPDYMARFSSGEEQLAVNPLIPLSFNIPSGVRLAARAAADTALMQDIEVAVYGLTF